MTRTGALLWKEWRDHRAALFVFAALVPLVSWPTQKWIFKFGEPVWTWQWVVPICVAPCVAVVAADSFAMDLATSRMSGFASLPVPLRRHFGVRTLFLALVAVGIAVWSGAANLAIAALSPKSGYATQMLDALAPSTAAFAGIAAVTAAVLVFSALGIGGFRAAIGGALLAGLAWFATDFAADVLVPAAGTYWQQGLARNSRVAAEWCVAAAILGLAAYAGFSRSRAQPHLRRRGVTVVAAILVGAFGLPASAATWKGYRSYTITADDADASISSMSVSPDGRHVAIVLQKMSSAAGYRSWIARTDGSGVFDWPRRNDYVAGWSEDGLAWVGRIQQASGEDDYGTLAAPESGRTEATVTSTLLDQRVVRGGSVVPAWGRWLRWGQTGGPSREVAGVRVSDWELWDAGCSRKRSVTARSMPSPTPKAGEALIVTAESKLCLIDLDGGGPRVVANDVSSISGWFAGSPDGRYYIVSTVSGPTVLDSRTWKTVAGPFDGKCGVLWCCGSESRAVLCVVDPNQQDLGRLVDVAAGRDIPVDPSLHLDGGYASVHALADGTLVARSGDRGVVVIDADGKLVRRLFPPQD